MSLSLFGGAISAVPGAPTVPPLNGVWQFQLSGNNQWGQAVIAPGAIRLNESTGAWLLNLSIVQWGFS